MARSSLFQEFIDFLKENKKWWLIPIIIVFGLLAGLFVLVEAAPVAAPFIYTLF